MRPDLLLRTACDVIAERGLANTRVSDVAAAAGVSQALVFYHFETKERLLAEAYAYAARRDLDRLDAIAASPESAVEKIRRLLKWYAPGASARKWPMWIDCWAESVRVPEVERVSRRLDLKWRETLAEVITVGVKDGDFNCADPSGAAWRIITLLEGLAVQTAVHPRLVPRRQAAEWIRLAAARELDLAPEALA